MESKILTAISKNVRLIVANTTSVSKEAIKYSEYDEMFLTSEIALLNIASIMSMNIKDEKGKIALVLKADGLLGNAKAIAKYNGNVMGNCLIKNEDIERINKVKTLEEFTDVYKVGKGNLVIEIDLGLKTPYLTNLEITDDKSIEDVIQDYYKTSEQLETILKTGVTYIEDKLSMSSALMIQALPGADIEEFNKYRKKLNEIYTVNELLAHDFSLERIAKLIFDNIEEYKILEEKELKFLCNCSEKYFRDLVLQTISKNEIIEMLKEKGYVECVCGFCNRVYRIKNFKKD